MMPDAAAGARIATAGAGDLLRLGARVGAGYLRHGRGFDVGQAGCRWARELIARDGGTAIRVRLGRRRLDLVSDRALSERVLGGRPDAGGHPPGTVKTEAMAFLAPGALTIARGEAWARLRPFNEHVLGTGAAHPFAQTFLDHVRAAFARPVANQADVRRAMGRAMTAIVLGSGEADDAPDPAAEAAALFAAVQSPVRRKLLGFRYRPRRDRFYALLARRWEATGEAAAPTLLSLARRTAPDGSREELLQQVPHWMFTFTGSGTDLLTRTLALVTSRAETTRRVLEEIAAAGAPDRAETVERLAFLNACLLETGRLFPPVTRTFHGAAPNGGARDAAHEAARGGRGPEYVHWFPLLQRDDALGPDVHAFRPDRWLTPEPDAAAAASNLFLRGPRACPGADLILFVCRAALARQLAELGVTARGERLARDPLPVAFPGREARFTSSEALR